MTLVMLALGLALGADGPTFEVRGAAPARVAESSPSADLVALADLRAPEAIQIEARPLPPLLGAPLSAGHVVTEVQEAALFDLVRMAVEVGELDDLAHDVTLLDPALIVVAAASEHRAGDPCRASLYLRYLALKPALGPQVIEGAAWLEPRVALATVQRRGCDRLVGPSGSWRDWIGTTARAASPALRGQITTALVKRAATEMLLDMDPAEPCGLLTLALELQLTPETAARVERVLSADCS